MDIKYVGVNQLLVFFMLHTDVCMSLKCCFAIVSCLKVFKCVIMKAELKNFGKVLL